MNALVSGGAYSLSLRHATAHVRIISAVLISNLQQGKRCALLTPMSPETFLKRCPAPQQNQLRAAIEKKQLLLFTVLDDAHKNIIRFGPERLLAELARDGIDDSALILVDQAEALFSLHHQENARAQLGSFSDWLRQRDCTALFFFSKISEDPSLSWTHYGLTEGMYGSAHLDHDHGEAELWIDFWQTPNATLGEHHVRLRSTHLKRNSRKSELTPSIPVLRLAAMPDTENGLHAQADDASDLYYLVPLALSANLLKSWNGKPTSGLMELVQATRQARQATVLVGVNQHSDWLKLAHAVHAIRIQAGSALRILILDQARCIRYPHEALLLRAGANLVLRASDALTRLPLLLESMQSHHYRPSDTVSFEQAVAGVMPTPMKGYVPPLVFCKTAQESLVSARALSIPCTLVALPYPLPQDLSTSMRNANFAREGDLLTIVSRHCYLFLYGCMTDDYAALLRRLLGNDDAGLLQSATFLNDETAILDILKSVAERCAPTAQEKPASLSASPVQHQVA